MASRADRTGFEMSRLDFAETADRSFRIFLPPRLYLFADIRLIYVEKASAGRRREPRVRERRPANNCGESPR